MASNDVLYVPVEPLAGFPQEQYVDDGGVEYVPVEEAGNYEPAEYPSPEEAYPEYEYEEPQLLENPLDTERKKSNRVALITVIVIVVIVIGLVFIFLYANLKKNKHTYDPFGGPVSIQNADGVYWGLGAMTPWAINVVVTDPGTKTLDEFGGSVRGLNQAAIVYVDHRKRDPNTRWTIKKEMSGAKIHSNFLSSFLDQPLEMNMSYMGSVWPPTRDFVQNSSYPNPLPTDDYGAFMAVNYFWRNFLGMNIIDSYEFISMGAKTPLGYPYQIKVLGTDPLGPDYYLAEIDPPNWPKGIDDPGTDQIDEGKVDFMNERKILYVSTTPQTWYIL